MSARILNFAYGSNMLLRRLRERAPSARRVGGGVLTGHRLCWHKVGQDASGKCDVVATGDPGDSVHGVLYEISATDKPELDRAEGLGKGYAEKRVVVQTDSGPCDAWVYYATATDPRLRPFSWYRALVVAGAKENALPAAYVEMLETAPVVHDARTERHARYLALARSG